MGQELDRKKTDSVFDFLYVDHHRVGLFLSQFSEFGNLTDLVHTVGIAEDSTTTAGLKGVLSVDAKEAATKSVQRKYNTQWSQALNFLDEINARQMLSRDILNTSIGGLVLSSGELSILNMRPLEKSWSAVIENAKEERSKSARSFQNRSQRRAMKASSPPDDSDNISGLRLLGSLDMPVLMSLNIGQQRIWSTLETDNLIGKSSDLGLKQGISIRGVWHVVGILDCLPGDMNSNETEIGRICGGNDNSFSSSAIALWRELALVLGRPSDCYGVTPIIIMREIKN